MEEEMNEDKLLSVIIPVYNVEQYLKRCIDSVLSQTFAAYEVILVDDGSTDSSSIICDTYANRFNNISVIHKENGGSSSARNAGIERAMGEYLLFIDSDDYLIDDDFFSHLSQRIYAYHEDMIIFGVENENILGERFVSRGDYDLAVINLHDKKSTLDYLVKHKQMPGAAWVVASKRKIVDDLSLRFPQNVTAEDYYWILNLVYYSKSIGAINDIAYRYCRRAGSITTTKSSSLTGVLGMNVAISDWLKKDTLAYKSMQIYVAQIFLIMLLNYSHINVSDRRIVRKIICDNSLVLSRINSKMCFYAFKVLGPLLMGHFISFYYKYSKKSK